jgi:ubiquinone/menaquinone biosynthesis C-methylase UbiE
MKSKAISNPRTVFFDSIADKWDGWHDLQDLAKRLDAVIEKYGIAKGETVLDVGCGTGNLTISLLNSRLGASGQVVAVDISKKMLERARQKIADVRVTWHCSSADQLPLEDRTIDHVICFSAWPHFHDHAAVARELHRVLRSGGYLHILHLTSRSKVNRVHAEAHPSVQHDVLIPASETAELLEKNQFRIISMTDDDRCYMITACKQG